MMQISVEGIFSSRFLKPENILLKLIPNNHPRAYISDMGTPFDLNLDFTKSNSSMYWCAPELKKEKISKQQT